MILRTLVLILSFVSCSAGASLLFDVKVSPKALARGVSQSPGPAVLAFRSSISSEGQRNVVQRSGIAIEYQQSSSWKRNFRGSLSWQVNPNLSFKARSSGIKSRLYMPMKQLCSYCFTQVETSLRRNGDVKLQLRTYFE